MSPLLKSVRRRQIRNFVEKIFPPLRESCQTNDEGWNDRSA
jgi:hypothetical protein